MKHLYTITGNLLAETTATYDSVEWRRTHRAVEERFQTGGKGINVAKMAQRLGTFSTAVCFPGGQNGKRCLEWLQGQDFGVVSFEQVVETRAGWVVRAGADETTFLGRDRLIEEEPWTAAIDFLARCLKAGDMLAMCGSMPGWRSALADSVARLLEQVADDVFVAVDTYGAPLPDILKGPVDLVKINRGELELLCPAAARADCVDEYLTSIAGEYPAVKRWVITAGRGPVVAIDEEGNVLKQSPSVVEEVSPVGCGDVLLAALVHELGEGRSLSEALTRALPLAAANAASPGIADMKL